jgi:hypothetical protein
VIGFLWSACRGYRLCPWKSPYLRWRVETYSGISAEKIDFKTFIEFTRRRRQELIRFLCWANHMRE